jgi:hypothetical protein
MKVGGVGDSLAWATRLPRTLYNSVKKNPSKALYLLLKRGPSSSMTTMDNQVGDGQGGVAATYCIDYRVFPCHRGHTDLT